jgi:hypothetical protein
VLAAARGRSFAVLVPVMIGPAQDGQGRRMAVRFCRRPVHAQPAQETGTRSMGLGQSKTSQSCKYRGSW